MRRVAWLASFGGLLLTIGTTQANAQSSNAASPTEKPHQPAAPRSIISGMKPEDCARQDLRSRVAADMRMVMPSFLEYPAAVNAYSRLLMDWKTERLRSGGWTKDDERKFGLMLVTDDRFSVEMEKGFGELEGLMKAMEAWTRRTIRPSARPRSRCRHGSTASCAIRRRSGK